jgi:hypothetical protein
MELHDGKPDDDRHRGRIVTVFHHAPEMPGCLICLLSAEWDFSHCNNALPNQPRLKLLDELFPLP